MARSAFIETPSQLLVVTLAEAKKHLRVSHTDDDDYITSLIHSSKLDIQKYCNIILMRTTVIQNADCWTDIGELYFSPVENSGAISLTHIKYYDDANVPTQQTWASSNYNFDNTSCPSRIGLMPNADLPGHANMLNAIEVKYSVGFSAADLVPKLLKQCILILCGQWYENRQEAVIGRSVGTIPMTARYIMDKYKIRTMGLPTC